jgi:hypothetical protein
MKRVMFLGSLLAAFVLVLVAAPPALAAEKDVQKFERTFPFDENVHQIGITVGEATIESVKVKNWPDAEDYRKAEKNPNDTKSMFVVFTYSNKGPITYKCKFTVTVLDPEGGKPWAVDDAKKDLDKNKVSDTDSLFVKMKTRLYKQAKTFKVDFEIWKK